VSGLRHCRGQAGREGKLSRGLSRRARVLGLAPSAPPPPGQGHGCPGSSRPVVTPLQGGLCGRRGTPAHLPPPAGSGRRARPRIQPRGAAARRLCAQAHVPGTPPPCARLRESDRANGEPRGRREGACTMQRDRLVGAPTEGAPPGDLDPRDCSSPPRAVAVSRRQRPHVESIVVVWVRCCCSGWVLRRFSFCRLHNCRCTQVD